MDSCNLFGTEVRTVSDLLKYSEVSQQPPQDDEDDDRAEAAATELLRTVSCGQAAQELAHEDARERMVVSLAGRRYPDHGF
jgi:hypothetical protein